MKPKDPLGLLRHHVSGAIERGEATPIVEQRTRKFDLFWSPEGRKIATVKAADARAAVLKAPEPYRKYLGEIYAQVAE